MSEYACCLAFTGIEYRESSIQKLMREKRVKQLLSEETGASYRQDGSVRAVLVFPNSYYLGMSSLGFQVILDEINRHPDVSCERAFFRDNGSGETPRSFEGQRPLAEFDIIGFSISFELDYFNVVSTLKAANIPLRATDREAHDPLIIAGGICSTFNPEPLADFVDAFIIGDGEEVIHSVISEYQDWRQTQNDKRDLHHRLSEIKGVYVPILYDVLYEEDGRLSEISPQAGVKPRIERFTVDELDRFDTASKILTPNTEFAGFFLVELTRGCVHRCKFCIASYSQKCRVRSRDAVFRLARCELAQNSDKIGLVGSSVTDHPEIDEIATSLVDMGNKISVASMRADLVSDALLDALAASGQKTITLAPEAASERLRRTIGKTISLDAILQAIRSASKKGIINIRLYFMIGLPTEAQVDVDGIVTMAKRVKQLMLDSPRLRTSRSPRLTVSISPFVPKPHTPLQWCQMDDVKTLSQKLRFLRRELGKIGGIRVPSSSARLSAIQGILARGDRRLANVLMDTAQKSLSWSQALKKSGISQNLYLQRPRQLDELLPWDHLDLGVSRASLAKQSLAISRGL